MTPVWTPPTTYVDGTIGSAPERNRQESDNSQYLFDRLLAVQGVDLGVNQPKDTSYHDGAYVDVGPGLWLLGCMFQMDSDIPARMNLRLVDHADTDVVIIDVKTATAGSGRARLGDSIFGVYTTTLASTRLNGAYRLDDTTDFFIRVCNLIAVRVAL